MSKSIISNKYECLICGSTRNLHRHHVFYGNGRRQVSEQFGCWVYLCPYHHEYSEVAVHWNPELSLSLKQACQRKLEEQGLSRERFINRFGKNYLGGEDDDTASEDLEVLGDE